MKLLIGSYNKNIYELKIENDRFTNNKIIRNETKPSFLLDYNDLSYIYQIGDEGYVMSGNESIKVGHTSCHISQDKKNDNLYVSHYQSGALTVIKNNQVHETITFENHSHIHYAEYIHTIDLVGVTDLGDNKFFLFESKDGKLVKKATYSFNKNYGPRHFTFHKEKPIIYLVTEHIPRVFVFTYENGKLELLEKHNMGEGAGSAIRIDSKNQLVVAGVRISNYLFSYKVTEKGLLELTQKVQTYGDHPRDFNISLDDKYLVVANMHSDNLTLFEIYNKKLYLLEKDYHLEKGASVIFKND